VVAAEDFALAGASFAERRPAEFAAPDDERRFQEAALLEVLDERRQSACPWWPHFLVKPSRMS